jgi:hypothetical protein
MKRCFKCFVEKPLSEFYRHAQMADGHLSKCRDCAKADVTANRNKNIERIREYDRDRAKQPHRIANAVRVTREWRQKHPDRQRAHSIAGRAALASPKCCEGCGMERPLNKHHHDYSKPLLVIWLCKPCHAIADKIRRRLESA